MPSNLTTAQQTDISTNWASYFAMAYEYLGYQTLPATPPTYTASRQLTIGGIVIQLLAIDATLANLVANAMAQKVGELTVDYGRQLGIARQEGSRLLHQLAKMMFIPAAQTPGQPPVPPVFACSLQYDKYFMRDLRKPLERINPYGAAYEYVIPEGDPFYEGEPEGLTASVPPVSVVSYGW